MVWSMEWMWLDMVIPNWIVSPIDNATDLTHAVYPNAQSNLRYATSFVYFDFKEVSIDYHIWVNETYAEIVVGDQEKLFLQIQNAVESAINHNVDSSIKPISFSYRTNPYVTSKSSMYEYSDLLIVRKTVISNYLIYMLVCSIIYTLYWSISMVNEKKGSMMNYMRSMGMMVI